METTSTPGRVHISSATAQLIMQQAPHMRGQITARPGVLNVKGKGRMKTYWLNETGTVVRSTSWEQEKPLPLPIRARSHSSHELSRELTLSREFTLSREV